MLTVKSPLRLMNSFVPSTGSTSRKASPIVSREAFAGGAFFGQNGHAGQRLFEPREDDLLGALIGVGDGAVIGLGARLEIAVVDLHHRHARIGGDAGEKPGQLVPLDGGGVGKGEAHVTGFYRTEAPRFAALQCHVNVAALTLLAASTGLA